MSKLIHRRTTVTNINYHIAWSTKRRKRVLVPELASDLQRWMRESAEKHGFVVHMVEAGHRDHVHVLVSAPPDMKVSKVLQILKGYTSRMAFRKYAFLSRAYPDSHMWNPSSFIESIGCISEKTVRKYIDNQNYEGLTNRKTKRFSNAKSKKKKEY